MELNESEILNEIANISKNKYNMPANILISTKGNASPEDSMPPCRTRIKIQNTHTDKMQSNFLIMTVPEKKIFGDTGVLTESDIKYFERFIDVNKDVLINYWFNNNDMFIEDVIESLKFDV